MTPNEIPQELIDILDRHAGKTHSRTGSVVTALAEILTRYEELRRRPLPVTSPPERSRDRIERQRADIIAALYRTEGPFTLPDLADAAGGQHLYKATQALVRDRVASGEVLLVDDECRPHLFELAPDE